MLPIFQIAFWLTTPVFALIIVYLAFVEFKFWKISMAISGFSFINAVALIIERYGNNSFVIAGTLLVAGIILMMVGQRIKK